MSKFTAIQLLFLLLGWNQCCARPSASYLPVSVPLSVEYGPTVVGQTLHSVPTAVSHQSQTIVHESRPYLRPIIAHAPIPEHHVYSWPVKSHVSSWPTKSHVSSWPTKSHVSSWPTKSHVSAWPAWPVNTDSYSSNIYSPLEYEHQADWNPSLSSVYSDWRS